MVHLSPVDGKGQGFTHKGNEFVHHTDLHYSETAFYNLLHNQKVVLISVVAILLSAFIADWHLTLIVFLSSLTVLYFLGLLFDGFIVYRTFRIKPEIVIDTEEMASRPDDFWPTYTIFCPLYKEWQVVPQFVEAMQKIDYPKEKLQVMFLLEENDQETIDKIRGGNLPPHFEIVVVPHSKPKTKPKAMNYGLSYATGEYLVIYDAEDVPDTDQLKKAVLAFEKASKNVVCIQAKLNFYNPKQNILTRAFTAEYSLWFDLILPGLQSIAAPIPLGGTSNHFRTNTLRELSGWDAFNVTEDCDLGMRLTKRGYRTAIVDSTTHEEANSDLANWYYQRSRWIKGYMQTYFVHMRNPLSSYSENKHRNLALFQLIVGMKTLSLFINPIMWVLTICYFLFRAYVGTFIESLFPGPILYIGVFSLIFGNFLYLYYYMMGCAKRGYNDIIKYAFLVPFYWLAMSAAAWQAAYEVVVKPHYWAKTVHGLHLGGTMKGAQSTEQKKEEQKKNSTREFLTSSAGLLVLSSVVANVLNFLFNAYLGHTLSLEDFGTVTILNTFAYVLALFTSALSTTTTHVISYLEGLHKGTGSRFYRKFFLRVLLPGLLPALVWVLFAPIIGYFLNVPDILVITAFAPAIFFGTWSSFNEGYLKGVWNFGTLALTTLVESTAKLAIVFLLVQKGFEELVPVAIPAAIICTWAATSIGATIAYRKSSKIPTTSSTDKKFPTVFYTAALMSGVSVTAFLSIDVIFAKHYLTPDDAGRYSMLSLVGKMIFFFGTLFNTFIVTLVSRAEGKAGAKGREAARNSEKEFSKILIATAFLTLSAGGGLSVLGWFFVPLLLGEQANAIVSYLPSYSLAMILFTFSSTIVLYRLARKHYFFPAISLAMSVLMWATLFYTHSSIDAFVHVVLWVNVAYFALVVFSHTFYSSLVYGYRNIRDTFLVFKKLPLAKNPEPGRMRILVFNWRDTKSVFAGGAETYVQSLSSRWVKEGHSVTLFTSNDGHLPANGETDGVRVIRRGGFYAVYVIASLYYLAHFRGKFDVIIDSENGIPFFTPLYAKEPVYCLVHHIHQEVFRKALIYPLAVFACFLEKHLMPLVYRNSYFITVSNSSKHEMEALNITKKEIQIVYPGIDTELLTPGKKSTTPTVSYVGRLKEHKSVHLLIEAFAKVVSVVPEAQLIIAGDGEEEKRLKRLAKKFELSEAVTFRGKVTEEEKRDIMRESWVFVTPSLVEGWGITTIEANACGTPVIASDVPGLRDSVRNEETGILVPYGDIELLAQVIERVLTRKTTRESLSKKAIRWAENFEWNKSSARFIEIVSNRGEAPKVYEVSVVQNV